MTGGGELHVVDYIAGVEPGLTENVGGEGDRRRDAVVIGVRGEWNVDLELEVVRDPVFKVGGFS